MTGTPSVTLSALVQDFFLRRLVQQRGASARTVESYRDTFRLLFAFAEQRTGRPPAALALDDLDAPLVLDFLDHLETGRGNSVRTRNARLAAIHSFMHYTSLRDPTTVAIAQRVLAIPTKRFDQPVLGYLSRDQVAAILAAPSGRVPCGPCRAGGRRSDLCGRPQPPSYVAGWTRSAPHLRRRYFRTGPVNR